MHGQPVERKLAAIFAADIAGYSRLMARDEVGTLARLTACRTIVDRLIASHRGRIFNTAGDSVVADFASAVDAVRCAVAVQAAIAAQDVYGGADEPMQFRIGVHVGDVLVDGENLIGDGVNIAARLEGLAEPGAICISGAARDHIGNKLPLAFDDLGDQQVKNIPQPIRVYRVQDETRAAQPVAALPLPDKPSIAVLPFQNISGDPEQEYFADGMVEEIITALSRIRWLFVIARYSSFTYKGQAVDIKRVGRELGVRYILEGSVRKGGNRVRITVQLIEAETGAHLWADRFDGALEDVFDLQDRVAISMAGVIEPTLHAAEIARSAQLTDPEVTAYDLFLRSHAMFSSSARRIPEALELMEQAIAREPNYGPALARAAVCCWRLHLDGRTKNPEATARKGIDFARRALEAGQNDPLMLVSVATTLAYFGENIGAMQALIDRALALNPNFAGGWHARGILMNWAGQPDRAVEDIEKAARLSPHVRLGNSNIQLGLAYFLTRRFEEAVPKLLVAIQEDSSHPMPLRVLAACYAHLGRLDEARNIVARLRATTPVVIPDASFLRDPAHRELFLSGLRMAAGEAE